MRKECSRYTGAAGDFCTITSSNIPEIKVGMKVVYAKAADPTTSALDSDVVLSGGADGDAHGHVILGDGGGTGTVTFDGGTGPFSNFHATADVTCPSDCAWDGTYSFK